MENSKQIENLLNRALGLYGDDLNDMQCKRAEEQGSQLFILVREYFCANNTDKSRLWDFSVTSCIYALLSYIQTGDEDALASFKEVARPLRLLRD